MRRHALRLACAAGVVAILWWRPLRLLVVRGGSMAPTMAPGDVAVVVRGLVPPPGAIACFADGSGLVCHRVVGFGPEGWTTKGDANALADGRPVGPRRLVGHVVCVLPSGGALARAGLVRSPPEHGLSSGSLR